MCSSMCDICSQPGSVECLDATNYWRLILQILKDVFLSFFIFALFGVYLFSLDAFSFALFFKTCPHESEQTKKSCYTDSIFLILGFQD